MNLKTTLSKIKRDIIIASKMSFAYFSIWREEIMPDFLVIGAPRSATTWMNYQLSGHPDIFLYKGKEIHFFDQGQEKRNVFNFLNNKAYYWRYYSNYFYKNKNKVKGDITPAYSILTRDRVKLIKHKLPNIKIIYSIRNPIDRAWSAAKKNIKKTIGFNNIDLYKLKSYTMSEGVLKRGKYKNIIKKWEDVYSSENILYIFFDNIKDSPDLQLKQICKFIEVDPAKLNCKNSINNKKNTSKEFKMPISIKNRLKDYYENDIIFLENKFGKDFSIWL